jgi:proteasome accessory factor C
VVAKPDRLERLTDLVLVLLDANRPLSLDVLAREVPGYPNEHDARRQAFERDKRLLREEGIPVITEAIGGPEQFGYRIDPKAFYLPDLGLDPDEQAALHLAVAGVHLGDPSGRHALLKLGATGMGDPRPVAAFEAPAALVPLFEALRVRAEVSFTYRGQERRAVPIGLRFGGGRWYLRTWDLDRHEGRTFRVDRIEGEPRPGPPSSGEQPAPETEAGAPEDRGRAGGTGEHMVLSVDSLEAGRVMEEVSADEVVERRPDGSVVLRLEVWSDEALRSWVLGLLDHAEVLGPPSMREQMVSWLESLADRPPDALPEVVRRATRSAPAPVPGRADGPAAPGTPAGRDGGAEAAGGSGRDARQRLRRLLAMVGWLARVGEAPIAEISRRFGVTEAELVRELELAACCGLPPYSPDALMEIVVTEQTVQAFLPEALSRPRRLTAAEGFALAAAARTILAVPGADDDGALARALAKLDDALGQQPGLEVDLDDPPLLEMVRRAVTERSALDIEYRSASSDETTHRRVEPARVVSLEGHWYVDAFCQRAGGVRRFRVDRIRAAAVAGSGRAGAIDLPEVSPDAFVPGPDALRVRLALDRTGSWVAESVPVLDRRPLGDGWEEVVLAVGGRAWFDRLLLQIGCHGYVVDPPDLADAGALAARRVLDRYTSR